MILLISGATHTGKTLLAQKLLAKYHIPYLSMDHLKMGLIRSGNTDLTPLSNDEDLTAYLWPIVREMVKTAIENNQSMTVEGCYIPFDWRKDFPKEYLAHIRCRWLIFSKEYIEAHFDDIRRHANAIETRLDDSGLNQEEMIRENEENLALCQKYGCEYFFIDGSYKPDWELV